MQMNYFIYRIEKPGIKMLFTTAHHIYQSRQKHIQMNIKVAQKMYPGFLNASWTWAKKSIFGSKKSFSSLQKMWSHPNVWLTPTIFG